MQKEETGSASFQFVANVSVKMKTNFCIGYLAARMYLSASILVAGQFSWGGTLELRTRPVDIACIIQLFPETGGRPVHAPKRHGQAARFENLPAGKYHGKILFEEIMLPDRIPDVVLDSFQITVGPGSNKKEVFLADIVLSIVIKLKEPPPEPKNPRRSARERIMYATIERYDGEHPEPRGYHVSKVTKMDAPEDLGIWQMAARPGRYRIQLHYGGPFLNGKPFPFPKVEGGTVSFELSEKVLGALRVPHRIHANAGLIRSVTVTPDKSDPWIYRQYGGFLDDPK